MAVKEDYKYRTPDEPEPDNLEAWLRHAAPAIIVIG